MTPFWHPLSTLFLTEPPCLATAALLRMMLGSGGQRLRYAGDAMWPAVRHGATIDAEPLRGRWPSPGEVVVACPDGIPDLLRVERVQGRSVQLAADSVPGPVATLDLDEILARTDASPMGRGAAGRLARRVWLDVREARGRPDDDPDPARTVRDKYDAQAPFYARTVGPDIDERLLDDLRQHVSPGARVLVVGSGVGHECFALAAVGLRVTGVDFSPAMVRLAQAGAAQRGLEAEFVAADIREYPLDRAVLDAALFTYDVYSFLPRAAERVEVLRRLRLALAAQGVVFLSARRLSSAYHATILTLQWLARSGRSPWGDSHTRWITADGRLRRSFVRVFTSRGLGAEAAAAGFTIGPWQGGHAALRPAMIAGRSAG